MKLIKYITSVIIAFYLLLNFFALYSVNIGVENYAREQARYMAKGIGECINTRINAGDKNYNQISYECGAFHRSGGSTGDFFVVNLATKEFIYDGSPDCSKNGWSRPFTFQGECSLHQDKNLCVKTLNILYQGNNSDYNSKTSWRFDDAKEWLEYYIIPSEHTGYNGAIGFNGIKQNANNMQLMIVMGTQSDEVKQDWMWIKFILGFSLLLGSLIIISLYYITKNLCFKKS